jgi:phosphatidylglycerophosphatase A
LALLAIITVVGFLTAGQLEKQTGAKDPGCVVIDEVCGMLISCFMLPLSWPVLITAYFLFRAFDMFKIYPAYKLEKLPGSVGIMMDDIVAGIYTNVIMHIALRFAAGQ